MRDMKKFISFKLLGAILENPQESRREWLLKMFEENGRRNSNNTMYEFWQQDNHPVELSINEIMEQPLNYLHNNTIEVGFVRLAEDYIYSSANNYAGVKRYIDIKLLE